MTTDIAKYSIGRLRPHFIDVCQPIYNGIKFTLDNPFDCAKYQFQYITDFECNPNNQFDDQRKRDARLSFMSGHSSFAAYCLIYLVVSYLWAFLLFIIKTKLMNNFSNKLTLNPYPYELFLSCF